MGKFRGDAYSKFLRRAILFHKRAAREADRLDKSDIGSNVCSSYYDESQRQWAIFHTYEAALSHYISFKNSK